MFQSRLSLFVTIVSLAISCAPSGEVDFPRRPRQDEAEKKVWTFYLERSRVSGGVPQVEWIFGERLDCEGPAGPSQRGFMSRTTRGFECVAGTYDPFFSAEGLARIALQKNDLPFSSTAFSHELYHAAQSLQGIYDSEHRSPAFAPGGWVEQADDLLRKSGL